MRPNRSVFVIQPEASLRQATVSMLVHAGFRVEEFASAEEFWPNIVLDTQTPACLLTESDLPGLSGPGLQERMLREEIDLPIIFQAARNNLEIVVQAIQRGAVDFLQAPAPPERILTSVLHALDVSAERNARRALVERHRQRLGELSGQETRVYRLLVDGRSSKEIAATLNIGIPTVARHRARVLSKMCVRNSVELARRAMDSKHNAAPRREPIPGIPAPFNRRSESRRSDTIERDGFHWRSDSGARAGASE